MSKDDDKLKHSRRLHDTETVIKRQQKIDKAHTNDPKYINKIETQGGRYAKHHAMDCGNPRCPMCGNPRRTWHELTRQEKRELQELDVVRMRHSNGTLPEDDE